MIKELRINRAIRAEQVRLIGDSGEQLGVMPTSRALQVAGEQGLDLVEVAPNSSPPVCRMLDYGRYRYEQTKKERKARQTQKAGLVREIRIRPRVHQHDLETKIKTARRLLEEGDKVKINVVFRGREIAHPELGIRAIQKVAEDLKDVAGIDGTPSLEGRLMHLVLSPLSAKQTKVTKAKEEGTGAKT